jgi:hypothetical protein
MLYPRSVTIRRAFANIAIEARPTTPFADLNLDRMNKIKLGIVAMTGAQKSSAPASPIWNSKITRILSNTKATSPFTIVSRSPSSVVTGCKEREGLSGLVSSLDGDWSLLIEYVLRFDCQALIAYWSISEINSPRAEAPG